MARGSNPSQPPDRIVEEIERTREQLAVTIDALVDRTSPRTIARRTGARVRAAFFEADGSPRVDQFAKVGGVVIGAVLVVVAVRRVVGSR